MTLIEVKAFYCFDDLMNKCWSGAIDTLQTIYDNNYEEEFMNFLLNYYVEIDEIPTLTAINDLLRFEDEYIFECIGLNPNKDEDEFEDEDEDEFDDEDEDEFED